LYEQLCILSDANNTTFILNFMDKNIKYKDSQNYSKEIVDVLEERNIP
jgi:hypothetical protein